MNISRTPCIKAYLAVSAIIGTALGPMSPGSAYVLLHHYMGDVDGNVGAWGFARGGMGAITQAHGEVAGAPPAARSAPARASSASWSGTAAPPASCWRAARRSPRRLVVSNMDVKRTFLDCVEEKELPAAFVKRVRELQDPRLLRQGQYRARRPAEFPGAARRFALLRGDLHFTDSIERMERAYDDWKAGRWSRDPFLDTMIPTLIDPTMTPPGKHFMSVFVQYAPPKVQGARDGPTRTATASATTVIDQIEAYAPGFRDLILHAEVRTPRELEAEVGLTEGNIFQGELTFDQLLFNRPVPGCAAIPLADHGPVDVRLLHPSRRRRNGRAGPQRRGRNPARPCKPARAMSEAYAVL